MQSGRRLLTSVFRHFLTVSFTRRVLTNKAFPPQRSGVLLRTTPPCFPGRAGVGIEISLEPYCCNQSTFISIKIEFLFLCTSSVSPCKKQGEDVLTGFTLLPSILLFCTIYSLPVFQGGLGWVQEISIIPCCCNQLSSQLKLNFFFFVPPLSPPVLHHFLRNDRGRTY